MKDQERQNASLRVFHAHFLYRRLLLHRQPHRVGGALLTCEDLGRLRDARQTFVERGGRKVREVQMKMIPIRSTPTPWDELKKQKKRKRRGGEKEPEEEEHTEQAERQTRKSVLCMPRRILRIERESLSLSPPPLPWQKSRRRRKSSYALPSTRKRRET